jgi:hypothetical protein
MQKFMTRMDADLGEGLFDSIAWALEVHAKREDTGEYESAMLFGNEDAPDRIDFYRECDPESTAVPAFVWRYQRDEDAKLA